MLKISSAGSVVCGEQVCKMYVECLNGKEAAVAGRGT